MVKKLLCSVCNDKYILGMEVLLYSLKKHNNIDFDMKIYNREDLSEDNKNKLKKIYNNLIFESINEDFFKNNKPHYMSLLAFKEYEYDRVIYIDCDILCVGNIEKLFTIKKDFSICYDTNVSYFYPKKNKYSIPLINGIKNLTELNTGLFVVNKKYLNIIFYNKVKNQAIKNSNKKNEKLWDQTVLNKIFKLKTINILPIKYNCKKYLFRNSDHKKYDAKLIHFVGKNKPFFKKEYENADAKYIKEFNKIYDLWFSYHKEYLLEYAVDNL